MRATVSLSAQRYPVATVRFEVRRNVRKCEAPPGVVYQKRSTMDQPNDRSGDTKPVIEPGNDRAEHVEVTTRALHLRIRQQEILAGLGVLALQGTPFLELLNQTARLTAEAMEAEFCKVLEYLPTQNRLLVRAGVGWHEGIVGVATVGADLESPSGFALRTGKPVISNHLGNEQRFRTPELLVEHGIRRAMNVILQGDGSPYGVLEVDSRSEGEFSEHDIAFLQGAANILGMAIERQRRERQLKVARIVQSKVEPCLARPPGSKARAGRRTSRASTISSLPSTRSTLNVRLARPI
jgi:hypothetical protein